MLCVTLCREEVRDGESCPHKKRAQGGVDESDVKTFSGNLHAVSFRVVISSALLVYIGVES